MTFIDAFQSNGNSLLPTSGDDGGLSCSAVNAKRTYKKAVYNTLLSVGAAIIFGFCTGFWKGEVAMLEFFTGYIVEQSLSVDNLFVFLMLFDYFKVPLKFQDRVLSWGIIGAVVMRGAMIFLGIAVVHKFRWVTLVFAGILLVSAYSLLVAHEQEEDLSENTVVKLSKYFFKSSSTYDEDRFFTKERGARVVTPLFMCLVCIELSDLVFAVDSIPAVLGVSDDPFIIYSSNIFAILGLRSLYVLVAKAINDMPYLKHSVAAVLGFIGFKMIGEYFHFAISTGLSLLIVFSIITVGVVVSLVPSFFRGKKGIFRVNNRKFNTMGKETDA
jgi:TerC family integral membrane protein